MMEKTERKAYVTASLTAALVFLVIEFIIESLVGKVLGVSEIALLEEFGLDPGGARFHIINITIFFLQMFLIMYVYINIRQKYSTYLKAALSTSAIMLGIFLLMLANFTNLGLFTIEMSLTAFVFNLIELPIAIVMGASVHERN